MEMSDELREMIAEYLKENLSLSLDASEVYTGGDPLYERVYTITLKLDGEELSSISLE